VDGPVNWRIAYHIATEVIVVLDVFTKKTPATPKKVIAECRKRLEAFQTAVASKKGASHARR
jgi:phage-related protein